MSAWRVVLGVTLMLLSISAGLWPGWLGTEWLFLGRPDFAATALAAIVIVGIVIIGWGKN